jgi:hypothetical protein
MDFERVKLSTTEHILFTPERSIFHSHLSNANMYQLNVAIVGFVLSSSR